MVPGGFEPVGRPTRNPVDDPGPFAWLSGGDPVHDHIGDGVVGLFAGDYQVTRLERWLHTVADDNGYAEVASHLDGKDHAKHDDQRHGYRSTMVAAGVPSGSPT
jgi:hypothetical protein